MLGCILRGQLGVWIIRAGVSAAQNWDSCHVLLGRCTDSRLPLGTPNVLALFLSHDMLQRVLTATQGSGGHLSGPGDGGSKDGDVHSSRLNGNEVSLASSPGFVLRSGTRQSWLVQGGLPRHEHVCAQCRDFAGCPGWGERTRAGPSLALVSPQLSSATLGPPAACAFVTGIFFQSKNWANRPCRESRAVQLPVTAPPATPPTPPLSLPLTDRALGCSAPGTEYYFLLLERKREFLGTSDFS